MAFNPERFLDSEARTGVREDDISDFLRKTDEVEKAIKGMMDGTLDPGSIKIHGLESEEEKAVLEAERQKRLEESRRKAEELRLKRKLEERERWWAGAELMIAKPVGGDEDNDDDDSAGKRSIDNRSVILQRYTADYSRWNEWVPSDPATLQEDAELKESEERKKNEEFEKNNPEFCEQFIGDMKERNKSIQKKKEEAEILRNKGNRHFKRKEYSPQALDAYMESLKVLPYEAKTLTNIAQVHIKLGQLDDALDFLGRTLALEPAHVKALSRQAFVLGQQKHFETALKCIAKAIKHDSASGGSNSEDLLAQQRELEIMAKEEGDEEALRNMLGPVSPAPSDAAAANLSASHAAAKSSLLIDFEVADRISAALGAALVKPPTALSDLLAAVQDHIFDKDRKKTLFDDLVARCGSNAMIKVHARTSGLLQLSVDFCVAAAGLLADAGGEDAAPASSDAVVAVTSALHFVTIAVGAERASKLVLLEQPTTLPALRSLLGRVKDPDVILAAANLFFVCCADDVCKKTQLAVLSDRKLVLLLATALGELLSRAMPHNKKSEEDGEELVPLSKACVACAVLIKEISFSEPGKAALAHAEVGCAICSLSSMLFHYAYSLQWEAHQALESALEALLGLSQVEVLRAFFAVACPVGPGGSVTASCVEVLLRHVLQRPTKELYSSTCLAVLMNACLDPEGAVRSVVYAHGGMDEALKGLKLGLPGKDAAAATAAPIPQQAGLVTRQAGLMSRLATVDGVQAVLYQPDNYRLVCRGISQKIDLEGKAHLVRTLAALSQPPEACRAVALEEHLVEALLGLFPRPREELGEITPQSVVLQPASPASPVLLGNAARCLMPYADDVAHAAILYKRRNLAGVEKLINAMATCTDIRVRKNLAILLAKGCRIEGIKDLVSHFRGMQMLTELQDKLVR
jgi:tetratricopeptide (TPR) repeat protein